MNFLFEMEKIRLKAGLFIGQIHKRDNLTHIEWDEAHKSFSFVALNLN